MIHTTHCLLLTGAIVRMDETIMDRFWGKVCKNGPLPDQSNQNYLGLGNCWLWTASTTSSGYGKIKIGRYFVASHRISFFLANGEIQPRDIILHKCDNPACVNPEHLYSGSHLSNTRDMVSKGRAIGTVGSRNGNSVLTEELVKEIRLRRKLGESRVKLAKEFNLTTNHITHITGRSLWKHI